MTGSIGRHDRDALVELMGRYAVMADTKRFAELGPSVLADEVTSDFRSLGIPVDTVGRDEWCARSAQAFAGWAATHHSITNHQVAVDGDRATIRAHVRAEHWAPVEVAGDGPGCWLVVGFYDDVAVRTPAGWRLGSITLTATHQEHAALAAAVMAAG